MKSNVDSNEAKTKAQEDKDEECMNACIFNCSYAEIQLDAEVKEYIPRDHTWKDEATSGKAQVVPKRKMRRSTLTRRVSDEHSTDVDADTHSLLDYDSIDEQSS